MTVRKGIKTVAKESIVVNSTQRESNQKVLRGPGKGHRT